MSHTSAIYQVDITALNSQGYGKSTVFYIKGTLTMFILIFWLCTGVLSPSILGWVINMEPNWMGALRLSNIVCSILSSMQQLYITLLLRKTLLGVGIIVPFLYKDDNSLCTWKIVCFWQTAHETPARKIHMGSL